MKKNATFFGLLFLMAACNSKPQPGTEASTPVPAPPTDTRAIVYLEGCYATSSRSGHDITALFDDNNDTYWETQAGAGPDEGIMLYFQQALPLASIQISAGEGSFDPSKAVMQVYVNGTALPPAKPSDKVTLGSQPIKSLYLRFNATGKETSVDIVENDMKTVLRSFPADASIRIRGIQLWNDKNEIIRLQAPRQVEGSVTASSTLSPASAYGAANLFDGRKEFVWVEGNAATAGENETLRFTSSSALNLNAIQIWNGYQRSDEHFSANTRVRDFTFGPAGGPMHTYTLRDTKAGQKIMLTTAAKGQTFELTIKSIYPGKRYKDLAISEILLFDGDTPVSIKTSEAVSTSTATKASSKASPLQSLLDHRISNQTEDAETVNKSLILRSDGTFVMYSLTEETGDQVLADGNWELLKADARSASVKVFGKWFSQNNLAAYYEGNTREEVTRIFNDVLTITPETVTGTKMIGEFKVMR